MTSKPTIKKRTIHALSWPYPEPLWPVVPLQLESTIIDKLITLLAPVTHYREQFASNSKGKGRKRQRKYAVHSQDVTEERRSNKELQCNSASPPVIMQYLTIGFNSTVRCLETLSQHVHSTSPLPASNNIPVAIFICSQALPAIMTAPLPLLVATASNALDKNMHPRLISISQSSADRIAIALKQPRVNLMAFTNNTPGSEELASIIRAEIPPAEPPSICAPTNGAYLPVNIHSKVITVTKAQDKKEKRKRSIDDVNR